MARNGKRNLLRPETVVPGYQQTADAYGELCRIYVQDLGCGEQFGGVDTDRKVREAVAALKDGINQLLAPINRALGYEAPPWLVGGGENDR